MITACGVATISKLMLLYMKISGKDGSAWVGLVALLVIVAVGIWWMSLSAPVSTERSAATSTAATTTATIGGTGVAAKPKVVDSSVAGVVAGLREGSRFAALFSSTGVAAQVKGAGPFTVFVPTNAAFAAASGEIANMTLAQKKRLAAYHVITDRALDPSATLSGNVLTLSRDYLNFSISPQGKAQINSSYVVGSYRATNGIVYLISAVLFPPKQ